MAELCLNEMQRGPGSTPWGITERLSVDDLGAFVDAGSRLMFIAGAIVVETSNLTPTPATEDERAILAASREPGMGYLAGIASAAASIHKVANRLRFKISPSGEDRTNRSTETEMTTEDASRFLA